MAKVARALEEAGADINRSCGLHVHIDAANLTGADVAKIVLRYGRFESRIDAFMPPSRRENTNTYTKTVSNIRGFSSLDKAAIVREVGDRYKKVNVLAISKHGTIEFRHHSGTVNATKIVNWIKFLQQFVDASCSINVVEPTPTATVAPTPTAPAQPQFNMPTSRSQRAIVTALRTSAHSVEQLCTLTGLTEDSLRCAISAIRSIGYRIDYRRGTRFYILIAAPTIGGQVVRTATSYAAPTPVRTSSGFAITMEAISAIADDLWNGIESSVRDFYATRAAALTHA